MTMRADAQPYLKTAEGLLQESCKIVALQERFFR